MTDTADTTDTDSDDSLDFYCYDMSGAGTSVIEEGGATGTNGRLEAQLISATGNARDTNIIGNAIYILESIDIDAGQRQGQATPLGEINLTMGSGRWSLRLQSSNGLCNNQLNINIPAQQTLRYCIPLFCE